MFVHNTNQSRRFQPLVLSLTLIFSGCAEEETSPMAPVSSECTGLEIAGDASAPAPESGEAIEAPTTIGSLAPSWKLEDVQPQSCGYGQVYGLDAFRGQPILVVLMWSGCGFCQAQAAKLQEMEYELAAEGLAVQIIIVNMVNERNPIGELTNRCTFPIFQDVESVDAIGLHGGKKDDFYFYDGDGVLRRHMTYGEQDNIVLNEPEGYEHIKTALVALINGTEQPSTVRENDEQSTNVSEDNTNEDEEPVAADEVDATQAQ